MEAIFAAVEGTDGSGTTTCSKLLVKTMNEMGHEAIWTKEPSDGVIGRHIRRILKKEEAAVEEGMFSLFLADRHDHIASTIKPHLEQGDSVIVDRYAYSTWVYQQDDYDPFLIEYMQRRCLVPDVVFVLHCPVEECMRRLGDRSLIERYETEGLQKRYHDRYENIPRLGDERIVHLDSFEHHPESLVQQILKELEL